MHESLFTTSLSEDLVLEARKLTGNRRSTTGRIRRDQARAKDDAKERRVDATIAMLNDLHDRHGGLGDEFSPL